MNIRLLPYFIFLLALLVPKDVHAQTLDLSVSPPIFQIELTPPANVNTEQELTVENTGDEPLVGSTDPKSIEVLEMVKRKGIIE